MMMMIYIYLYIQLVLQLTWPVMEPRPVMVNEDYLLVYLAISLYILYIYQSIYLAGVVAHLAKKWSQSLDNADSKKRTCFCKNEKYISTFYMSMQLSIYPSIYPYNYINLSIQLVLQLTWPVIEPKPVMVNKDYT